MENRKIIRMRELRRKIDALDRALIKIIQRRITAAKGIGKLKSELSLPVFCPERERKVMQRALSLSKQLSVNPKLSGRLFQLVIRECRNVQAEFIKKPDMIIIGNGKMGKKLSKEFNAPVLAGALSELKRLNSPKIILLAVPFSALSEVAGRIKNFLNKEDLVMDISSAKTGTDEIFNELPCGFLATHPLFGPNTEMPGQRWVITGERANALSCWFKDFVSARGCKIVPMAPEAHDRAMAILQGLNHFMLIAFNKTIRNLNFDARKIERFSTASSRLTLEAMKKVSLSGSGTSDELISKPMAKAAIKKFIENVDEAKQKSSPKAL